MNSANDKQVQMIKFHSIMFKICYIHNCHVSPGLISFFKILLWNLLELGLHDFEKKPAIAMFSLSAILWYEYNFSQNQKVFRNSSPTIPSKLACFVKICLKVLKITRRFFMQLSHWKKNDVCEKPTLTAMIHKRWYN